MPLNNELFLGIDGGGTTTKAAITRQDGSVLAFGGDEAQIIAITRTEVVIGAKSSVKTWAIELKGPPADQTGAPCIKAIPNQP